MVCPPLATQALLEFGGADTLPLVGDAIDDLLSLVDDAAPGGARADMMVPCLHALHSLVRASADSVSGAAESLVAQDGAVAGDAASERAAGGGAANDAANGDGTRVGEAGLGAETLEGVAAVCTASEAGAQPAKQVPSEPPPPPKPPPPRQRTQTELEQEQVEEDLAKGTSGGWASQYVAYGGTLTSFVDELSRDLELNPEEEERKALEKARAQAEAAEWKNRSVDRDAFEERMREMRDELEVTKAAREKEMREQDEADEARATPPAAGQLALRTLGKAEVSCPALVSLPSCYAYHVTLNPSNRPTT